MMMGLNNVRKVFPKELDQKLLAFDIVEARVAIQEKLSLLDRFHFEVEHGLLEADCLFPYYAYYTVLPPPCSASTTKLTVCVLRVAYRVLCWGTRYMAGDHNMDALMRCNEELLDAVVQPLIDDLANLTSQA
jgi:hypothetical protein